MEKIFQQKNRAFTLVETLVAISIFSMSIIGLMATLASGVANTGYAKQKVIAGYLAQEGIEYVRNMRDTYVLYKEQGRDWNKFKTDFNQCNNSKCGFNPDDLNNVFSCNPDSKCKLYVNNGNYRANSTVGTDSGFTRKVWKENVQGNPDVVKIYSNVTWGRGSITFSEILYNWWE